MRTQSFSRLEAYLTCSYYYYLKYVLKLKPRSLSSNLVYGKAVHSVIEHSFLDMDNFTADHAVDLFNTEFEDQCSKNIVKYGSMYPKDELVKTGAALSKLIPDTVKRSRLVPAIINGKPAVEHHFKVHISGDLYYQGYIDLACYHLDWGQFGVVDSKTSTQACPVYMPDQSNQLKGYSLSQVDPDMPPLEFFGFWDFLKRKVTPKSKGPQIMPLKTTGKFAEKDIDNFIEMIVWVDEQVENGCFFKQSRQAYNTPCAMCDYQGYCYNGDSSNLK